MMGDNPFMSGWFVTIGFMLVCGLIALVAPASFFWILRAILGGSANTFIKPKQERDQRKAA